MVKVGKKLILLFFGAAIMILSIAYWYYRAVEVEVSAIERGAVVVMIAATGRVEAKDKTALASRVGGRVVKLFYDEGDEVKKGDVVAVLESRDIDAAVEEAEKFYKAAMARLDRLAAGSRTEEIEEAEALVIQRKSELELAKSQEKRGAKLMKYGFMSQSEYDDLLNALNVAKQQLEASQKRLAIVRKGPRQEEIDEARRNLEAQKAILKRLKSNQMELIVVSAINGVVTKRPVEVGQVVAANQTIMEAANPDNLEIKVQVEETDAGKVKTGQTAYLLPDIFPDKSIKGKVIQIAPVADYTQGTIEVTVKAEEKAEFLKPGMTVDTSIEVQKIPDRLLVPLEAVFNENGQEHVYVIRGSRAKKVKVETGINGRKKIELISGVKEGDKVVISSKDKLRNGRIAKIKNR